jgi:hypothetical protein
MSSQIEDISNHNQHQQEQSLPDPKRIKLTNDFEKPLIKVKSCTNSDQQQQVTSLCLVSIINNCLNKLF